MVNSLFVTADAKAVRALYPEDERFRDARRGGARDRVRAAGDLPGVWRVPVGTALVVRPARTSRSRSRHVHHADQGSYYFQKVRESLGVAALWASAADPGEDQGIERPRSPTSPGATPSTSHDTISMISIINLLARPQPPHRPVPASMRIAKRRPCSARWSTD